MKSFSLFIAELNEGQNNAQFTGHFDELLKAVKAHGLAGALRITIKVLPATRGNGPVDKVLVSCDSQLTLPKPTQPSDIFYLTDDAEPTRKHPRQQELALQGVRAISEPQDTPVRNFGPPDEDGVLTPRSAG